ncbi:MAG: hypothetical protein HY324_01990, partial [Chlamydiia bacterium]|nr:hypothetical protein [Chlamydiia bacterium]
QEYCTAKFQLTTCLKEGAPFFVSRHSAPLSPIPALIFETLQEKIETILPLSYRDRVYPHDLENIMAAYALTGIAPEDLKRGVATFVRPPHRLEFVKQHRGVEYVNDSKATSVDAVIKAVSALKGPIVLIAGGVDKGGAFRDWIPFFRGKVSRVLALGAAAQRIEQELAEEVCVERVASLREGVARASQVATSGETVLLSPGCSSYDHFRDYQHRGEVFKQSVEEIEERI